MEDLQGAKCLTVDEETELVLMPANLGRIAAFYSVSYQTIGLFAKTLDDEQLQQNKLKALISVLSQASEFRALPIRENEEALLQTLASQQTYPLPANSDMNMPHVKANVLLQAHFDRRPLPLDLNLDQKFILTEVLRLVHAMVDVISTNGHLMPSLQAMELSQMCVQAVWPR